MSGRPKRIRLTGAFGMFRRRPMLSIRLTLFAMKLNRMAQDRYERGEEPFTRDELDTLVTDQFKKLGLSKPKGAR